MKLKKYITALLIAKMLALSGLYAQTIVGYSGLFTFNTKYAYLEGESELFTFNTKYNNLVSYSGSFTFDTRNAIIGYYGLFSFNVFADFMADKLSVDINERVQFTDLTDEAFNAIHWVWDFGDGSGVSNLQNPVHSYRKSGKYTVKLTATNSAGVQIVKIKPYYIFVNTDADGIMLQIVKTANTGPNVAKVGYYQTRNLINEVLITFDVVDNFAYINDFPTQWNTTNRFKNKIFLFDQNQKRLGYINYAYDPDLEGEYIRNAIIILHNDTEILADGAFPYNKDHDENDEEWKYYKQGDYPVSMLIPPKNSLVLDYSKKPLLLIHGWEGEYELKKNPDAVAKDNEASYWFTLPRQFDNHSKYDVWQYYYPYNSAHKHLAICLKYALNELKSRYNKKTGVVTHSMGGLVTLRYLTQFNNHAKNYVEKVLFSAPPAHGSLGANLYYKTYSGLETILGYDRYAPAVRDMGLGSDATWFIHKNTLPDLNNKNGVIDDYFVLIGTTYFWYKSDTRIKGGPHSCLHLEAEEHHDGIVAISSASLLDKGIGFATFHGNHNDAVHMQSYKRNYPARQNIGDEKLMKYLIEIYFDNSDHDTFLEKVGAPNHITAVVKGDRTVIKSGNPIGGNSIDDLTHKDVNYKKGIINIKFPDSESNSIYRAFYGNGILHLYPNTNKKSGPASSTNMGVFKRNVNSLEQRRYFFNEDVLIHKGNNEGRTVTYRGCAINLPEEREITIQVYDENDNEWVKYIKKIDFKYCETNNVEIIRKRKSRDFEENYTDKKVKFIVATGNNPPDSLSSGFYADNQTTFIEFRVSCLESAIYDFPINLKLKTPDNIISDSTFLHSYFEYDRELGEITIGIPEPMPGLWHIWLESSHPGADTVKYNTVAVLQSGVLAHLPDKTENLTLHKSHNFKAGLKVDDFSLARELKVFATMYKPDWQEEIFDITSNVNTQDSSFIFNFDYYVDLPGEYIVKYNIDGIYDNYNFERCLYQFYSTIDTIPLFVLPDIVLRQQEPQRTIDLKQHIYNIENYDTIYFTNEVIFSNLDSTAFIASFDSLAIQAFFSASLADTGIVVSRYTCHYDNNSISDTMTIKVVLPELYFVDLQLSDAIISNNDELVFSYSIGNSGNTDAASYRVGYYIAKDPTIQTSDYCIGSKTILFHNVDTVLTVNDTITIPSLEISGSYYLIVKIDALDEIIEINEENNMEVIEVVINPKPVSPIFVSATPSNESVFLTWEMPEQSPVNGYVIYYGLDSLSVLHKAYTLSTAKEYLITGLNNGTTYFFAVSSYKYLAHESVLSSFVEATPVEGLNYIMPLEGFISENADICFAAEKNISVSDLTIESNSFTKFVAGESIVIRPQTIINAGANFQAYIDTTGTYCQHEGPSNILTLGGDVSAGVDTCLAAINRILVSDLIIESNAVIKLVAGELIVIHPHTRINSGADFRAYIDTTGTYCHQPESMMVVFDDSEEITDQKSIFHKEKSNQFFSLFPNPTAGTFTLQLNDAEETTEITVDIYSLLGELIVQTQLAGKQQYEFDLRGRPDGVYLIRVLRGKEVGVDKLIKQ